MKRIVITYSKDGSVTTDAQGFHGKSCVQQTEKLLAGINAKVQKRQTKAEFHEVEKTAIKIDQRQS